MFGRYLLLIWLIAFTKALNDTEIQQRFASVLKEIAVLKKDDSDLQQKFGTALNAVSSLQKDIAHQSEFCKLTNTNPCGPCTCLDDPRNKKGYYCDCQQLAAKRDCKDFYTSGYRYDGLYKINMNYWYHNKVIQVWCDQTTDGGGWTVFQRRIDGTTNFYRGWSEYREGFGDLRYNFWLGNEKLHYLTYQGYKNELRIDMVFFADSPQFIRYGTFSVGYEWDKYRLHVSNYYSGSAGEYFYYHNGMKFSTYDNDNDNSSGNCATTAVGGWWYNSCTYVHLNGVHRDYEGTFRGHGIYWYYSTGNVKTAEMKVRRTY